MNTKILLCTLAISIMAVFHSCNYAAIEENNVGQPTKTLPHSNERLSFHSETELADQIVQMQKNEEAGLSTKVADDFISLNDYLRQLTLDSLTREELAEVKAEGLVFDPDDEIIADPYFGELLNPKREIEVDGKIYKFIHNGILRCDIADAQLLEDIEQGHLQIPEKTYDEFTTIKGSLEFITRDFSTQYANAPLTRASSGSVRGNLTLTDGLVINQSDIRDMPYKTKGDAGGLQHAISSIFGKNTVVEVNYDKRHRMKLRMYQQDYVIYSAIGMTVRMQQRRLRIWWRKKADEFRFGWKNIELCHKFKEDPISLIPTKDLNGKDISVAPHYIKAKFPFTNTEHVLFAIPFGNYKNITTGDANKLFQSAMNLVAHQLKNEFKGMKQGTYSVETTPKEFTLYSIVPQYEKIETDTGREVARFDLRWFSGTLTIGLGINSTNGKPSVKQIDAKPAKKGGINRGEVYAAVKYNGEWKAARIYTE